MVEIVDSSATALPPQTNEEAVIAGAVHLEARSEHGTRIPSCWETFPRRQLKQWLDDKAEIIHGTDVHVLEAQLQQRYPSPTGTTRVLMLSNSKEGYRYNDSYHLIRWLATREPIITVDPNGDVLSTISTWTSAIGAVLVRMAHLPHDLQSADNWRQLGYAATYRANNMMRINFSPKSAATTIFNQEKVVYEEQMRGYFDPYALACLVHIVAPHSWPWVYKGNNNKRWHLKRIIVQDSCKSKTFCFSNDGGSDRYFGDTQREAQDLFNSIALCKRLMPRAKAGWWRKHSDFDRALRRLATHLEGVEKRLKTTKAKDLERGARPEVTRLCKWIRHECKIAKIQIPKYVEPKLVLPKKPKPKRKRGPATANLKRPSEAGGWPASETV